MKRRLQQIVYVAITVLVVQISCGRSGDDLGLHKNENSQNLKGSITSQSGSQSDMAGWVIALIERKTQIARLAAIDSSGLFEFLHVKQNVEHTMALMSPGQILRSVLAHPNADGVSVSQYFRFTGTGSLPLLIHKGLVLSWQETEGLIISSKDSIADIDGDGVPEGVFDALTSSETSLALFSTDTDNDGTRNLFDSDLDGDGMINIFDHNIDNDVNADGVPLLNEFDTDSNGDLIRDTHQLKSRAYFETEVQWATLQYEMIPAAAENQYTRHLTFIVRVNKESLPAVTSVRIRRAPSLPLLDDATVTSKDSDGNSTPQPWDGKLLDDGLNEDGAAGDGLFSRRVNLKVGSAPATNQVISFQAFFGNWAQEYLYTFPPIRPLEPKPMFNSIDRSIVFNTVADSKPFGVNSDFVWIAAVYEVQEDDTNKKTYTSQAIPGSESSLVLPDNVVEQGRAYRYKIIAQSHDLVPGYAVFKIESRMMELE